MKTQFTRKSARQAGMLCMLLACVVGLMALLKVCSSPHPFSSVALGHSGGDTLDVAIQYSPLMLYNYDDTLGGFSYDVMRAMGQSEDIKVKFHPIVSLPEAMERLRSGVYDIVIADLPRTDGYRSEVSFTVPLYLDRMVLVQQHSDSLTITSQLNLAGREVWVPVNSPAMTRLQNLSGEIGDTIYVRCDEQYGPEQLFIQVATGDIGLAVINRSTAEVLAREYTEVDINTSVSFTQFQSWLVSSSDTALCQRIDSAIVRFRTTPAYDALVARYGLTATDHR